MFHLAAQTRPEPLIVPIALANFDKKLSRATLVAVVHEPFRLSDKVPPPGDAAAYRELAGTLREDYRSYVQEAVDLADAADEAPAPFGASRKW